MDPDRVYAEVNDLSRRNWDRLPEECAAADGRRLASKINQLIDWIGSGARLPAVLARAQRLGPAATPVSQAFTIDAEGHIRCVGCGTVAREDESEPSYLRLLKHKPDCREVKP